MRQSGFVKLLVSSLRVSALSAAIASSAHAALQGRNVDGNMANGYEAFYDTTLDITWLADPNFGETSNALPATGSWWSWSKNWAESLNYFGATEWRLPRVQSKISTGTPADFQVGFGAGVSKSELGHMFYVNLQLPPGGSTVPDIVAIPGLPGESIKNFRAQLYWTEDVYAPNPALAWALWTSSPFVGSQAFLGKVFPGGAWAVHDGDVFARPAIPAVPEPSAIWMMLAGIGVAAFSWRRQQQSIRSQRHVA